MKKIFSNEKNGNKLLILGICLVLGIIFLAIGEYSFNEKRDNGAKEDVFDEESYAALLEERLCAILEEMEGVENVSVMVTLEGGIRYRYANESTKSQSGERTDTEVFLILQEKSGDTAPILTETLYPSVRGVSVVCQGANDPEVKKKVIDLVASTLNLNQNQIFVSQ